MEKKQILVNSTNLNEEEVYELEMPLDEFINKLVGLKGQGYNAIKIGADVFYEKLFFVLQVFEFRPETDEEFAERVKKIEEIRAKNNELSRSIEFEEFQRLKDKFEPNQQA